MWRLMTNLPRNAKVTVHLDIHCHGLLPFQEMNLLPLDSCRDTAGVFNHSLTSPAKVLAIWLLRLNLDFVWFKRHCCRLPNVKQSPLAAQPMWSIGLMAWLIAPHFRVMLYWMEYIHGLKKLTIIKSFHSLVSNESVTRTEQWQS